MRKFFGRCSIKIIFNIGFAVATFAVYSVRIAPDWDFSIELLFLNKILMSGMTIALMQCK